MCRHPAWADIIQSREEELLKLKNAALAASIAEESQNRERLERLQEDYDHQVQVIQQKEDDVNCLQDKIDKLTTQHMLEMKSMAMQVQDRVDSITQELRNEFEKEYKEKFNDHEEKMRESIYMEYRHEWETREEILNGEFTSYVADKLKEQESQFNHKYQCLLKDKDDEFIKIVESFEKDKSKLKTKFVELQRQYELTSIKNDEEWAQRLDETKTKIIESTRIETTIAMQREIDHLKLESEEARQKLNALCKEKDLKINEMLKERELMQIEIRGLQSDISEVVNETDELKYREEELLDAITSIEKGYVLKKEEFEREKSNFYNELAASDEMVQTLRDELNRETSLHKSILSNITNENNEKESGWTMEKNKLLDRIRELEIELRALEQSKRTFKVQRDQEMQINQNEMENLKSKILNLENEYEELQQKGAETNNLLSKERETSERLRIDKHDLILSHERNKCQIKDDLTTKLTHQINFKKSEIENIRAQMDHENNKSMIKISNLESELTRLKIAVHELTDENANLKKNENDMQSKIVSSQNENKKLVDTIAVMRAEMDIILKPQNRPLSENTVITNEKVGNMDQVHLIASSSMQYIDELENQVHSCMEYFKSLISPSIIDVNDKCTNNYKFDILKDKLHKINETLHCLRLETQK